MEVVKRNGQKEELIFAKMKKVIDFACEGHDVDPLELESALLPLFRDGITTKQIQSLLVQVAVEKTNDKEPDWQFVAAKLFIYDLYKEAAINRNYSNFGYGNLYDLIVQLTDQGLYGSYIIDAYSKEDIKELGAYIKPERDYLFNYIAVKTLADRYVISGYDKSVMELPQEMFMGVAMHLAMNEKEKKVFWAMRFYDVMSKLKMTVATPTLSNARKPFHQLSSCFIDMPQDDLVSLYKTNEAFARVSKHGGGMGIYVGKVRARGSNIRKHKRASGGVVPFIRNYNNTAVAVDQLGVRSGAVAVYLDVWHKDIFDFLNLKTNNGDDRMKAHDIFPGVCIPDLFMKLVEEKGEWHLFDPHEIRQEMGFSLEDAWGEEWEWRYWDCVDNPNISRVTVPVMDIMKKILQSAFETGTPFIFFRDTANRLNPNKHKGMVYCSNLCTEIIQNMSPAEVIEESVETEDGEDIIVSKVKAGDFVVCNLASIHLGNTNTKEDIAYVVSVMTRMLDNVIDLNLYPLKNAEITNRKYRAIGIGTHGYHQMLATKGIQWESQEHLDIVDTMYEWINYNAVFWSMMLSYEKGSYPLFKGSDYSNGKFFAMREYTTGSKIGSWVTTDQWRELSEQVREFGLRNGYLMAIAPNGSTAVISVSTSSIDPVFDIFFVEEKKNYVIPQTVPNLNINTRWFYKNAFRIDQEWSIKAAGVRQRHIDQSQSFNIYITPEIGAKQFMDLFMSAWKSGLKTTYYVRNKSLEVEDCVNCEG